MKKQDVNCFYGIGYIDIYIFLLQTKQAQYIFWRYGIYVIG